MLPDLVTLWTCWHTFSFQLIPAKWSKYFLFALVREGNLSITWQSLYFFMSIFQKTGILPKGYKFTNFYVPILNNMQALKMVFLQKLLLSFAGCLCVCEGKYKHRNHFRCITLLTFDIKDSLFLFLIIVSNSSNRQRI